MWSGVFGVAAAGVLLAACGGNNSSSDSASLRIANATINHKSLDLLVNSAVSVSGTASDTVSVYVSPSSGANTLQLNDAGGSTALATLAPTLTGGYHYTLLAYESGGNVKAVVLPEDVAAPAAGVTLRIYDTAVDAGKLDVYVTANDCTNLTNVSVTTSFAAITSPAVASVNQGAGTWNVCVTGGGTKTDLRMSMPITITNQTVATVALTPASGGILIDGSLITQQGAYAGTRNPNVRVRMAAAVSGAANVTATATTAAGSVSIDPSGLSPAFGFYTLIPATSTINVGIPSGSVASPTGLVAGSDMTLLVYGSPSSATAKLLLDDNRPPTDSTTVKMRLINGVTGTSGALTFTVNSALVATGVAPDTASAYTAVAGSSTTALNLNFTSSLSSGNYYSTSTSLNLNSVYSVMLVGGGGDGVAQQVLIR